MMLTTVLVALTLHAPPPPAPPAAAGDTTALDDAASALARVRREAEALITSEKAAGRALELVAIDPASSREGEPYAARAGFVDRTGGCLRGWVRVTYSAPRGAERATVGAREEVLGAPCTATPDPTRLALTLFELVARGDGATLARTFLPRGEDFPLARETIATGAAGSAAHELTRVTVRAADLETTMPLPSCAPPADWLACDATRPSGRTTCRCTRPDRRVEIDLQRDPGASDAAAAQLVSVRVRVTAPAE